jgi:hypothetical protein
MNGKNQKNQGYIIKLGTFMKLFIIFLLITFGVVAEDKTIVGSGNWTYEVLTDAIELPKAHASGVQDYHGVAVDSLGRVYVGYYSKKVDSKTRSVARFNYDAASTSPFTFDRFLGDSSWVPNRVHGVNIIGNSQVGERLLLVYNKQQVILCDLDGNVDKKGTFLIKNKVFKKASDGNKSPKSESIGIYDGYATNKLYELKLNDGSLTGHVHGAKGRKADHTDTAHGIGVDPNGDYVIADRGNKRLVWRSPDFKPRMSKKNPFKQLQLATPGLEVCNVQFKGDVAVVPCLNAKIAILEKSDKEECGYALSTVLSMPKELIKLGYDGIHDVNFSNDMKYLIVAVWQRKKNIPPKLFALRRLANQKK